MNSFFLQESQTDFAGPSRQFSAQGEDIWLENQNDFRLFLRCDGDIICDCLPFPHWFCHPHWLKTLRKTSSVGSFVYGPRRENTCHPGFRQSETQIRLLGYRD